MKSGDLILETISRAVTIRSASALARTVGELITTGGIPVEARLPTIRAVSTKLGMSRSAVGQAWRNLQSQGLVESNRRGGTTVIANPRPPHAKRFETMMRASLYSSVDLGNHWWGEMDPIDLSRAFAHAAAHPSIGNQFPQAITAALEEAITPTFPFQPTSFLAAHGVVDALELSLSALIQPGDRVIVAIPTPPRVLDILESLDATTVPISWGEDGPRYEELRWALIGKPAAFVYQPTRGLPTGRSVTKDWIREVAPMLSGRMTILEFDQSWPLDGDRRLTLGTELPNQVVYTRSYNYMFGSDMRLAVSAGPERLINILWMRLSYSSRYVSRIMQEALAYLLTDSRTLRDIALWDLEIRRRHCEFSEALRRRGHVVPYDSAPMIWLSVPDEHSVCSRLSMQGIVVYPGALFRIAGTGEPHITINTAARGSEIERLANEIADACDPILTNQHEIERW